MKINKNELNNLYQIFESQEERARRNGRALIRISILLVLLAGITGLFFSFTGKFEMDIFIKICIVVGIIGIIIGAATRALN